MVGIFFGLFQKTHIIEFRRLFYGFCVYMCVCVCVFVFMHSHALRWSAPFSSVQFKSAIKTHWVAWSGVQLMSFPLLKIIINIAIKHSNGSREKLYAYSHFNSQIKAKRYHFKWAHTVDDDFSRLYSIYVCACTAFCCTLQYLYT